MEITKVGDNACGGNAVETTKLGDNACDGNYEGWLVWRLVVLLLRTAVADL